MTPADSPTETLREYGRILGRAKWMVLAAALLVPLVAILLSLTQDTLYSASMPVLLTRQNVPATSDQILFPDRFVQGQATFARSQDVATTAAQAADVGLTGRELLEKSAVVPSRTADALLFTVTDRRGDVALRAVRAYAIHYTLHRQAFVQAQAEAALEQVESAIRELRDDGGTQTPAYRDLVEQRRTLRALAATRRPDAFVFSGPGEVEKVRPLPFRNGVFGLALGLGLGIVLALLRQALDRRVRSSREVSTVLRLPVLGRVPSGPQNRRRPVGLDEPTEAEAEALHLLRTNLDAAVRRSDLTSLVLTSATPDEGRAALAAHLARALARTGRRILLVDSDLYRGGLTALLGGSLQPGLTDVVAGRAELALAIAEAKWGAADAEERWRDARIRVLPSGTSMSSPGDLYVSPRLPELLRELRTKADLVIMDGPSAERPADLMAISEHVDSLLVVASLRDLTRPALAELRRVLDAVSAVPLGVAITAAERDEAPAPVDYASAFERSLGSATR